MTSIIFCLLFILKVGVRLSDGRQFFAKTVISNATRWDTFGEFHLTLSNVSLISTILYSFEVSVIWMGSSSHHYFEISFCVRRETVERRKYSERGERFSRAVC